MAEYESGYCTGCGMKARTWGHRPHCWRMIELVAGVQLGSQQRARTLGFMARATPFWMALLYKPQHMYYHPAPEDTAHAS